MKAVRALRAVLVVLTIFALVLTALGSTAFKDGPRKHSQAAGGAWLVQRPVSYRNLTIYPIRGREAATAGDYITLDEGIKSGTVVITERGTSPMARTTTRNSSPQQQVNMASGDGASVNQLALINKSGKKLLLMSGEVIVGGKQDRIVEEDRIISAVSVPVSLNVFCVEHGRWQQRAHARGGAGGEEAPVVAPTSEPRKAENFYSLGAVAHPKLRGVAQDKKMQSEVWKEVSSNNAKLGTANTTDTYQAIYASKKVAGDMNEYMRVLEREVLQPGVVGVVVARNGELVWADVFASTSLFARYWPKLLKSYVIDAMSDYRSERQPTIAQAQNYLNERDGAVSIAGQPGVYQLVKTEQSDYAVFELRDIALPSPLRLHFNKMER
jgi:hypothetical protein